MSDEQRARGLMFTDHSVLEILAGRKRVTRRFGVQATRLRPGVLLYVKEAYSGCVLNHWPDLPSTRYTDRHGIERWAFYRAGFTRSPLSWRSPMFMPRAASRLLLRVESVDTATSVGRSLASIDVEEAIREGAATPEAFRAGWAAMHGDRQGEVTRIGFSVV